MPCRAGTPRWPNGSGSIRTSHALRHYSATELLAAGVDLRTVAGRLGHGGGGATTLRVYAAWGAFHGGRHGHRRRFHRARGRVGMDERGQEAGHTDGHDLEATNPGADAYRGARRCRGRFDPMAGAPQPTIVPQGRVEAIA